MESPFIKPGFLEVYCGPMKSGKTREVLNRIDKIKYVNDCKFLFIKPKVDTRDDTVKSRFGELNYECLFIDEKNPNEILDKVENNNNLIIIDEFQFFSKNIIDVIKELQQRGLHIIVCGLDLDFRGEPFGEMPNILALADEVHKLKAVCEYEGCNNMANRTQRLIDGEPASYDSALVLIGDEKEGYCVRCLKHHYVNK